MGNLVNPKCKILFLTSVFLTVGGIAFIGNNIQWPIWKQSVQHATGIQWQATEIGNNDIVRKKDDKYISTLVKITQGFYYISCTLR